MQCKSMLIVVVKHGPTFQILLLTTKCFDLKLIKISTNYDHLQSISSYKLQNFY